MIFIGIDPGKTGGVAVLNEEGDVVEVEVMKDLTWFCGYIKSLTEKKNEKAMIFIEKAQAMGIKINGTVSIFTYAQHFGELIGTLQTLGVPHEQVPPITWCKVMHVGTVGDRPKIKSRMAAQRIFPSENFKNPDAPRSTKDHEGIIDALLIAEFGRRKWRAV